MTAPGDGPITNPWLTGSSTRQIDRAFSGNLAAGTSMVQNRVIAPPAKDTQTTVSQNHGSSENSTTASLHQNEESQ